MDQRFTTFYVGCLIAFACGVAAALYDCFGDKRSAFTMKERIFLGGTSLFGLGGFLLVFATQEPAGAQVGIAIVCIALVLLIPGEVGILMRAYARKQGWRK